MHRQRKRQPTPSLSRASTPTGTAAKRFKGKSRQKRDQRQAASPTLVASRDEEQGDEESVRFTEQADVVLEGEIKDQRILSLHGPYAGNLAAAWYDPEERKIQVLEDTKDTLGWDLACLVMEQVRPTLIIMSSKTQNSLIDKVEAYGEEHKATEILLLPSKSCYPKSASLHLSSVRLPDGIVPLPGDDYSQFDDDGQTANISRAGNANGWRDEGAGMGTYRLSLVKLGCWVNVHAPLAIVAAGILVNQVKRCRAMEIMPDDQSFAGLELAALESMNLDRYMLINKDALTSLAIFDVESHAFMHSNKDKQALSIFGKLDCTVTPLGHKLFHTWHLRPLLDLAEISARHDAVALFSDAENEHVSSSIRKIMKSVRNVPARCTRLRTGRGGYVEWKCLVDALTAALEIRNLVLGLNPRSPIEIIDKVIVTDDLIIFCQDMNAVIDWDTSRLEGRVAVRPGIDEELDGWREVYAGLDVTLNKVAQVIYPQVPPGISQTVNVVYLPQLGYLAVVQADAELPPAIEGWESRFQTEDRFYYKTAEMHDLDDHFGDLYTLMIGKEIEIVQRLTEHLKEYEPCIMETTDVIAELDCILALARAVKEYSLRRPTMTEEPVLKIRKGRHILSESLVPRYIENDTMIASGGIDDLSSMMIITGANGSGKSAYGKQVALISFMAQIGSFVPAEEAEIGICDKIFTRLQTRESSSRHASAFMIDLGQISQALRGATERSLIIIDEFGKGTNPADGAGLLAGTIEYLLQGASPRSIVMTHFHELFANGIITEDRFPVRFCHMKTVFLEGTDGLQYLYKLVPELSLGSNAAECALRHGIPKRIVDRAREVTECVSKFEISKLLDATLTDENRREIKAAEELAKRFLTWDIDPETEDVMEVLREMLKAADLCMEEDLDETSEKQGTRQEDEDTEEDSGAEGDSLAPSDETD
ncbi:hypothetical protein IAT38_004993 [Cryptococcus sp. DSM 104549]